MKSIVIPTLTYAIMKHLLLSFFLVLAAGSAFAQVSVANLQPNQQEQSAELRVYPNPTISHFEINDNDLVQQVAVFNLVGRQVKRYSYAQGEKYYVGDLPRGMYLVQLVGNRNAVLTTRRINVR